MGYLNEERIKSLFFNELLPSWDYEGQFTQYGIYFLETGNFYEAQLYFSDVLESNPDDDDVKKLKKIATLLENASPTDEEILNILIAPWNSKTIEEKVEFLKHQIITKNLHLLMRSTPRVLAGTAKNQLEYDISTPGILEIKYFNNTVFEKQFADEYFEKQFEKTGNKEPLKLLKTVQIPGANINFFQYNGFVKIKINIQ